MKRNSEPAKSATTSRPCLFILSGRSRGEMYTDLLDGAQQWSLGGFKFPYRRFTPIGIHCRRDLASVIDLDQSASVALHKGKGNPDRKSTRLNSSHANIS